MDASPDMVQTIEVTTMTLFWLLTGAALVSSAITLLVVFLVVHFHVAPQLEERVELRLQQGAADLEDRLRRRVLGLVTGGKAVKDLARGMGLFSSRPPPDDL
ncbi:MAG: hypothetical protein LAT61_14190 [Alcanivorax sp.]|nr:hypothetical protein [Alcanivorax sp.]